ncbi:hypothetical protein V2S66_29445 [Streptomyces sp. V4-01]|uniref:Uncharacterized protein n=1 Tax=Actinacidiphila polyblastidii TaxID=3110430 RepID=A0ABU7PLF4_9ACTN|nr:hypothetical protein [Streptomyces sp. V4-01]
MRSTSSSNVRWTKDRLGAYLAATTGFLFALPPAFETARRLVPDHAHTLAALVGFAVAALAHRLGLRVMRRLP